MRSNILTTISLEILLLACAMATGSPVFLFIFFVVFLLALTGYAGIIMASRSMKIDIRSSEPVLKRGEDSLIHLIISFRNFIPVAPVRICLLCGDQVNEHSMKTSVGVNRQEIILPFHASHIGIIEYRVKSVVISDLFNFFHHTCCPQTVTGETMVIPDCFEIEPVRYAPGEPGSEIMARATEDLNAPSDFRSYQPGDALKKIHWKLSARKGDLIVRKYEEPELPDVLILMDCSEPPSWGRIEAEADIKDTLLETAASVFASEAGSVHGVRMHVYGHEQINIDKGMGMDIVLQYIASVRFGYADRFDRILLMEACRLNQIGSVIVISARLNSMIVDAMIRIMRLGPVVRLYLITYAPDDANVLPLISKLKQSSIEVSYVSPAAV